MNASATTAASRNTHTKMNSTATYGDNLPVAAPAALHQAERGPPRRRVVGEATVVEVEVADGRARGTGGREMVVMPPQLRAWEGYGEDFFYYLSGVE